MRPTHAIVDLNAIQFNLRQFQQRAAGRTAMAVVKSNAYGHGLIPVARTLRAAGAAWLAVATVEEGITLREAGDQGNVLLVGPLDPADAPEVVAHRLTSQVGSLRLAEALAAAAVDAPLAFHLKVDTGLHRLGVAPAAAADFLAACRRWPQLRLTGIYTHFARADLADREFTRAQLDQLRSVAEQAHGMGYGPLLRHAAGSSASILWDEAHLDAVRPGISLYGYYPCPELREHLTLMPALQLLTAITDLHAVPAGESAGYGTAWIAQQTSLVATLPIGFTDGLPRPLAGRGSALVRGRPAPFIGISLDSTLLDVTAIPGVCAGDAVVLIGPGCWADAQAAAAGTIVDEIVSRLGPRVRREYVAAP